MLPPARPCSARDTEPLLTRGTAAGLCGDVSGSVGDVPAENWSPTSSSTTKDLNGRGRVVAVAKPGAPTPLS